MAARRALWGIVVAWSVSSVAAQAQAPPVPETRIVRAAAGGRLTPPSSASSLEILGTFLRSRGHSDQTARSVVVVSESRVARTGVTHLRLEQRAGTLRVYGVYVKASLSARGELISVIENLVPIPAASAVQGQVGAAHALQAALKHLYGDSVVPPGLARREGDTEVFVRTPFFHAEPRVTPVAVPRGDGLLGVAYLVETWSQKRNLLHHTLVGGAGDVRGVENRTASDSYKVFANSPGTSAQTVEAGAAGWLFTGNHSTVNITGNNVNAYLDTNADNLADAGGTAVTDGNFLTTADLTSSPGTAANRAVSVQNLFYLNNVIHDRLLEHGFDEGAGNFQETNSSGLGVGSDSVNAEAQDGSGTDNANFATPADGSNPRMQMYLWTGFGTNQVVVGSETYLAQGAVFGPAATVAGTTAPLALVNDGSASTHLACGRLPNNSLAGRVAVVDRGTCDFITKVKNVQRAGAVAAVVANNVGGLPITMGGTGQTAIPSVMVSLADGNAIKAAAAPSQATVRVSNPTPLMRDSAVDSDIVWHEYGHGLTWRMIGGMSGPMAGAIGEGMSDVLAILINEDDRVGEYAASDPLGIRSAPYTNYPRTYGDFSGTGVHFDGEIYGAIGWRLLENFGFNRKDDLLGYLVEGMNETPATPTFEHMRDGILVGISNQNDRCRVWDAFVAYGVGDNASARISRRGVVTVTESFDRPAECPAGLTTAQ